MNKQELTYHFFIIIPPGLEAMALLELQKISSNFKEASGGQSPFEILQQEKGGIEIKGPLACCALININAKIPSRVLLRLDSFRCRDFPKLYQKIKKIKWGNWCYGPHIKGVQCSSKNSILFDSRKIIKATKDALSNYFKENPPKKKDKNQEETMSDDGPQLFLRFIDDNCTLSLDTSGERLGKRGLKEGTHISPLRENLAQACLQFLFHKIQNNIPVTMIDPMCGSGTFITESLPYQLTRNFAFNVIPLMAPIKRNSTKRHWFQQTPHLFPIKELIAHDLDQKAINSCQKNIKALGQNAMLFPSITVCQKDFFIPSENNHHKTTHPIVLICNPPYGERIKLAQSSNRYLESFIKTAIKKFSPDYLALLFPQDSWPSHPKNVQKIGQLDFNHGGIEVSFRVFSAQI